MKRKSKNNPNKLRVPILVENVKQDEDIFSENNNIIKPTPRKTNCFCVKNNFFGNNFTDKQHASNGIGLK